MTWSVIWSQESPNREITIPPGFIEEGDLVLSVAKVENSYISGLPTGIIVRPTVLGISSDIEQEFFLTGTTQASEAVGIAGAVGARFEASVRFQQPGDGTTYRAYDTGIWSGIQGRLALCVIRPEPAISEVYCIFSSDPGWDANVDRSANPAVSPPLFAYPHRETYDEHEDGDYIGFHGLAVALNPDSVPNLGSSDGELQFPAGVEEGSLFQIATAAQSGGVVPQATWTHYDTACMAFSALISSYIPTYDEAEDVRQGIPLGELICVEPRLGARPMSYTDDVNPFNADNPSGVVTLDRETCTLYALGDYAPPTCD